MYEDNLKDLIGKIIVKVDLSEDKQYITFWTDEGLGYIFYSESDGQSDSWIESIENVQSLLNEKVIDIFEHCLDVIDIDDDGSVAVYNYDIRTGKGICTIDFRDESNGYHGGRLMFVKMIKEEDVR